MIRLLSMVLILAAGAASACGARNDPCEAGGGIYLIEKPVGVSAPPALMFLHGWGGSAVGTMKKRHVVETALARGYAVIAPQGTPRREGDTGAGWNSFGGPNRRDDVAYLLKVADDVAARHGVDRDRILLGGFSGGGMMTWRTLCDAPEAFAAYAPAAGLLWRPLPKRCAGAAHVLHVHGWTDAVVPIEGRTVGGGTLTQGDLFEGIALLRETLGCAADAPDVFDEVPGIWLRRWTSCAPGASVTLGLHQGAHRIPASLPVLMLDWFEGLDASGG